MNINYEGLVCYLNSNKNSKQNNVWLDSSGNNNNATLTSFSDNDFNGSYVQFNGNNYAVIPRCIQDDFTLSAEVILESSTSTAEPWQLWYNYASLIDAETAGVRNDFGLTISKDGHAYFGIGNPDRTIPYAQKSLFNEKHIITCTRKKDTGEYAMYIDGILIKKEIHPNKNSLTYPSEIYVGKGINNRFLSMKLFSIRIYNRVLDNFEIKQDSFFVKNKVYVNENNLPIIVDKLTDAKNIKISNNKYGNRVQTVIDKIVEKADDITKAIKQEVINDSYSFKVGTGDVDVSADVEDGFGEVGIKGVTYQNIFKNVHNRSVVIDKESTRRITIPVYGMIKPSTVYTLILIVKSNTLSQPMRVAGDNNYWFNNVTLCKAEETGTFVVSMTSKNTTPANDTVWLGATLGSGRCDFTAILLEGDHTNNPNLPSYFEGIVGVGDKSKNLFNKDNIKQTVLNLGAVGSNCDEVVSQVRCSLRKISCKPNTKYTIKSDKEISVAIGSIGNNNIALGDSNWRNIYNSYTYTTPSDAIELAVNIAKTDNTNINIDYVKNFNIQIEEGETSTSYEPYYDGHKIEILSNGKNLVNPLIPYPYDIKKNEYNDGTLLSVVKAKPNTTYTMSVDRTNEKGRIVAKFSNRLIYASELNGGVYSQSSVYNFLRDNYANGRKFEYTIQTGSKITFTTLDDCNFIYLNTDGAYGGPFNNGEYVTTINNVQIEEGTTVTSYVPYVEDKIQILLDEPLMRLPNGVCDEITRDGKLIRRVGKVVLTDIKDWYKALVEEKTIRFAWHGKYDAIYKSKASSHGYCDTVLYHKDNSDDKVHCRINGATPYGTLIFWVDKSQLTTETSEGFKQWLSQNPTTVYYELAEPIITELPAPYLRIFKDGHLTFNTLVAPESNHVVQLNKSGQIQNAIKESQSLDNRISVLENNYDNLMLSTISRLNNLELDYTLK